MNRFWLLSILLFKNLLSKKCFTTSFEDEDSCFACSFSHFYSLDSPSLGVGSFPSSLCQEKKFETLILNLISLAANTINSELSDSYSNSFRIGRSLGDLMVFIHNSCKTYSACEVHLYLESGPENYHIIHDNLRNFSLFRRLNISLFVDALPCRLIDVVIKNPATIYIKSTSIIFFCSGLFRFKNLEFNGVDMNFRDKTAPCFLESVCCLDSAPDYSCAFNFSNLSYSGLEANKKLIGLLMLETIFDDSDPQIPSLNIENCTFLNFQVPEEIGLSSILQSVSLTFFRLTLSNTVFNNLLLTRGIINIRNDEEEFTNDPVYARINSNILKQMIELNLVDKNILFIYLTNIKFATLKSSNVNGSTNIFDNGLSIYLSSTQPLLFYAQNLEILNISSSDYSTRPYFIQIIDNSKKNSSTIYFENVYVNYLWDMGFLLMSSASSVQLRNLTIYQSYFAGSTAYFVFDNILESALFNFSVGNLTFGAKVSLIKAKDCLIFRSILMNISNFINTKFDLSGFSFFVFESVFIQQVQIKEYLLLADSSTKVVLKNFEIRELYAYNPLTDVVFNTRSEIFNMSQFKLSSIVAKSLLLMINVYRSNLESLKIFNLTSILYLFEDLTTFYFFRINNMTIQNSTLPRVCFLNNLNEGLVPSFILTNSNFIDLILPPLSSEFFISFLRILISFSNTSFTKVYRVNHSVITPLGIIQFRITLLVYIENCSFISVGYSYAPRAIIVSYNFPLVSILDIRSYIVKGCYFELDEKVSINSGIIISGLISVSAEIYNSAFIARSKRVEFVYNGMKLFHSPFINISYNIFSNLSCTWVDLFNNKLRTGVVAIHGEDSFSYIRNSKKVFMISNYLSIAIA